MSRLAEFRALEQQLAAQLAELESLKNDDGLKREIEFEKKLRDLLGEYGYSLSNIVAILKPRLAAQLLPQFLKKAIASHVRPSSIKTPILVKSSKLKVEITSSSKSGRPSTVPKR